MASTAFGYPGMGTLMAELAKKAVTERAAAPELMGDLLVQGATTPVGNTIKDCLLGNISCQATPSYTVKVRIPIYLAKCTTLISHRDTLHPS